MSTKPESTASGTLVIPHTSFYKWASTFLPAGAFYAFAKLKDKVDTIEIDFNMDTESVPQAPPEP